MALVLGSPVAGCRSHEAVVSLDTVGALSSTVEVAEIVNGAIPSGRFTFRYESDVDGQLASLRTREQLETVIRAGQTEFDRFVLLMNWVNGQWAVGNPDPYPPWNAFVILDQIRRGRTGGFCAQYAVVFAQACLAVGCQARYIDLIDLYQSGRRTHFTVEVWSNDYQKWVLMDPAYNVYFQRNGIPLNAFELHEADRTGAWQDLRMIKGRSARGLKVKDVRTMVDEYAYFALDLRNDHLSRPQKIWVHDGGLDWSDRYDDYLIWSAEPVPVEAGYATPKHSVDVRDFYWSVNQTHITVTTGTARREAIVRLDTYTPNFQSFLVSRNGGPWAPSPGTFQWPLNAGMNELAAKSVNAMGVSGVPARVRLRVHGGWF